MLMWLIACRVPLPDARVLVSDSGRERFVYVNMASGETLSALDLTTLHPEDCGSTAPETATCLPFQSDPVQDAAGNFDAMLLLYDRQDTEDSFFQRSAIERVSLLGTPSVEWRLETLDFSGFPGECAAEPCSDGGDQADLRATLRCRLAHAHDYDVLDETDTHVQLAVADTANDRVVVVTLEKAGTCGQVDALIRGETAVGWGEALAPNDVDAVSLPDGRTSLVVTFRTSDEDLGGLSGGGFVSSFAQDGEGWASLWRFPESGFLNAPHDASVYRSAAGVHYLVLAHSNGAGAAFQGGWTREGDPFGSVTVARFEQTDQLPDYRFDVVSSNNGAMGFLRSAVPWVEGVEGVPTAGQDWLIGDSGCLSLDTPCAQLPALRSLRFSLDDETDGAGTGAFEPGGGQQTMLDVRGSEPLNCGFGALYVADPLWGPSTAVAATGLSCDP